ncbi:hypothetical protein A3A74_08055 [Candidatus Roizmanbacteria bacterium RIFCSPLOWO2_01_FULL_35_13]|uniref:DUF4258 domain-containing protein n=1 Tax=Candidatus Roizmanbacteria bacterium RIFCSPLOWO2_01_FULL_35_13 TaxID=1802055 RepID=A0A1F7IDY8_9BACT|nr:MAG: hypothetical protein A3A74_08055 [Candidatus Roizmanbacteria bacterium RIFCSPLOWO2_01_FULL_35_13]
MKIVFTKHASVDKVAMLKKHNFTANKAFIKEVIEKPDHEDKESDFPKIIASKSMDSKHVLRVVYKLEDDIITVITFYPAPKGRYY